MTVTCIRYREAQIALMLNPFSPERTLKPPWSRKDTRAPLLPERDWGEGMAKPRTLTRQQNL
ncbi:hypothetical protein XFF6166_120020 [Xanthomonas citri pv. fuscans]|nr:hypothetical protein XFF6166_120020 [Xanthomonas citri pv. fuscans]SON95543.1 hypothetical protein XFF7767_10089 [Xanthomonas citri pv. fuscans]SON99335.1 hypothetical protein XFF6960_160086 [Xanthomonas citri pv. fuscans]SOO10623.1 hypothetical protein XFF6970_60087 [Xanthomonas citri pv. fuscans]SOO13211.1 hypothetical protein XFF7766_140018 [Xanthomonas citri pv. fuscans]